MTYLKNTGRPGLPVCRALRGFAVSVLSVAVSAGLASGQERTDTLMLTVEEMFRMGMEASLVLKADSLNHQMAAQASEEDIKKAETKDFRYRYHHNQPMMAEGILAPKTGVHPYHHEGMMTEGMMHHPDDRKLCDGERTRKAPATAEEKEQRKKALAADYQRRK